VRARDVGGEILVVSKFTPYADTRRGRRPSSADAARPEAAEPLVEAFGPALRSVGATAARAVSGRRWPSNRQMMAR
jgi:D-tyrosyl-tRNA(Tyr) deacylase